MLHRTQRESHASCEAVEQLAELSDLFSENHVMSGCAPEDP